MDASFPERVFWNFYIIDRNGTTFEHKEDVPNFTTQMVPVFIALIVLEEFYLVVRKGKHIRINDGVISIAHGMIMDVIKLFTKTLEVFFYEWLYEKRFWTLDWESPWTWWAAAISVDFCYYWVHRAVHEVSLFWASHQVHHSSEEYNLTTALRQSAVQHLFSIGFYLPLALLGVPTAALLVHLQFNLFAQFWIHTETVSNLGPIEWIFNTASHHRVHHGINKWCLDKNYAGFLIIWDRIFGTFEPERKDEKIIYGLVSQPQTMNPLYLQVFYFRDVIAKSLSMKTFGDKLKALFFGPGWNPGTPRLGDEDAIPDKTPEREKYDPKIPFWVQIYLLIHFTVVILVQQMMSIHFATFHWMTALVFIFFIFFSLYTIGCGFEGKWWVPLLEVIRCLGTLALLQGISLTQDPIQDKIIFIYFVFSSILWSAHCLAAILKPKQKMS
ncbi:UNVERIFIED_CONTAM: hypothetical protein RMT77_004121 [Armadillidium vulgare]